MILYQQLFFIEMLTMCYKPAVYFFDIPLNWFFSIDCSLQTMITCLIICNIEEQIVMTCEHDGKTSNNETLLSCLCSCSLWLSKVFKTECYG